MRRANRAAVMFGTTTQPKFDLSQRVKMCLVETKKHSVLALNLAEGSINMQQEVIH